MHRHSLLSIALPVLALAACSDVGNTGAAVGPLAPETVNVSAARGAQLARDLCFSCHGPNFNGGTAGQVTCPSLSVLEGYSLDDFDALLSTGLARDGDVVDQMNAHWSLSFADRVALHEYLSKYLN